MKLDILPKNEGSERSRVAMSVLDVIKGSFQ